MTTPHDTFFVKQRLQTTHIAHCSRQLSLNICLFYGIQRDTHLSPRAFLADRTIGRAFGILCRLPVVGDVLYCGETVRPIAKNYLKE